MKFSTLTVAVLLTSTLSLASADTAIEQRQTIFKAFKKEMSAIKEIVSSGKTDKHAAIQGHAKALDAAVRKQWDSVAEHFPVGSDQGDTDALPEIWTDPENFNAAIKQERDAVTELLVAVEKADAAAWAAGFKQVGAACKKCHEQFKKD